MEEFQPTENTLAKWSISKNSYRTLASLVFLIPFAIFITGFIGVYFVLRSINIVLLIVPIILFLPVISAAKEFWDVLKIYKENIEVYITDNGVYVRYLDHADKYDFISWYSIKQFDTVSSPQNSFFQKMIPLPTRFVLKTETETENIAVDAVGSDADLLRNYLQERNIPFGFKTD